MRQTLHGFGAHLVQVTGWAVLLAAGALFFQTVVTDAGAQGGVICPLIDGVYVCNNGCIGSSVGENGKCAASCNNRPGTSCDACGCSPTFAFPQRCGCN